MNDILHIEIHVGGAGLCNQIYALISGIELAIYQKKHIVVINSFRDDYSVYALTPVSEVFDLHEMNNFTKTLDIELRDWVSFPTNLTPSYDMCCPTFFDHRLFDMILRSIRFHPVFVSLAKQFTDQIEPGARINALHLRLEDDAIRHWSKSNNMSENEFRMKLTQRYISMIKEHVDKTDVNLILSYSTDNGVLDFMKENGYRYMLTEKNPSMGREKNAIVDTLIAQACNNVMLANVNFNDSLGSSFSYFVAKRLMDNVKCVAVDIRDLGIADSVHMTPV
jgi:ribosomal protein S9